MKNLFIEGLEKTQTELAETTLKNAAVMILGSVVTSVGICTMLRGQEKMVEANTLNNSLNIIKEGLEKVEVG